MSVIIIGINVVSRVIWDGGGICRGVQWGGELLVV